MTDVELRVKAVELAIAANPLSSGIGITILMEEAEEIFKFLIK